MLYSPKKSPFSDLWRSYTYKNSWSFVLFDIQLSGSIGAINSKHEGVGVNCQCLWAVLERTRLDQWTATWSSFTKSRRFIPSPESRFPARLDADDALAARAPVLRAQNILPVPAEPHTHTSWSKLHRENEYEYIILHILHARKILTR